MTIKPAVGSLICRSVTEAGGREVCGYLTLDLGMQQAFHRITNRSVEPDNFWISRVDSRRFMKKAARQNLRVLAFLHSHRSSLELSRQDKISLDDSEVPWIVVAVVNGQLFSKVYYPESLRPQEVA